MRNFVLFAIPSLIWGSTWLAIKFQLGVVDPMTSVFYRFLLAGVLLLVYCYATGRNLKFTRKQHGFMALLGTLLFGVNYWLVYMAEVHLTSGLVALVFSTIIFLNIFFGALFIKSKIRMNVVISAVVGYAGVALVFRNELLAFSFSSDNSVAFLLALISAVSASLGNITSAHKQKLNMPVLQSNAFGMLYGSLVMLLITLFTGTSFTFDLSFPYVASLLYLTVFGSVVAFTSYLTLLGNIGADKSAYVTLVIPVIALILSTVFEGYQWTASALVGVVLILLGNIMVLRRKASPAVVAVETE